jgi:hypothetical protein
MPSLALSSAEDKNKVRRALPTAVSFLLKYKNVNIIQLTVFV